MSVPVIVVGFFISFLNSSEKMAFGIFDHESGKSPHYEAPLTKHNFEAHNHPGILRKLLF
jgi:hypothetical protein